MTLKEGTDDSAAHLKRAALPPETRTSLGRAPLGTLLQWGSAPPPSAMARLDALVAAVQAKRPRALSDFLSMWRAVGAAAAANANELDAALVRRHADAHALLPLGRTLDCT